MVLTDGGFFGGGFGMDRLGMTLAICAIEGGEYEIAIFKRGLGKHIVVH